MDNQRGISFVGSVALLVSAMTGPGLVTIPLLFQISGWLMPTIMFFIAMSLGAISSLLLCEALTTIRGNEHFQRKIEFTHLSNFLVPNRKVRIAIQVILYLSIESVIIASIILSAQALDLMLLKLAGRTCGLGLHPNLGFFCINDAIDVNSPFGSNYMLATFGFLITLVFCAPLSFLDLVDNIVVQIASFGTLVFIVVTWIVTFILTGLHKDYVPLVSDNQSQVVGTVLFNYAFITTVPSWVNDLRPNVSIRKAIWCSVIISTVAYMLLGILGGMTYQMDLASNIIAEIDESSHRNVITDLATFVFPVAVLLTSIPVDTIVVRYNLKRSGLFKERTAILLSTLLPWIIVLPFQTGFWLNIFTNWTSILFASASNFIIPFYLYYLSQNQPEIVELREKDLESSKHDMKTSHETIKLIAPTKTKSEIITPPTTSVPPSSPILIAHDTKQLSSGMIEKAAEIINSDKSSPTKIEDDEKSRLETYGKSNNNLLHPYQALHHRNNRSNDSIHNLSPTLSASSKNNDDVDDSTWYDNNDAQKETFTAFPVNRKYRMTIALFAGSIAVILVGGIIFYDFIKLALGSNVFDLNQNN